jgi:hypothetical protein
MCWVSLEAVETPKGRGYTFHLESQASGRPSSRFGRGLPINREAVGQR